MNILLKTLFFVPFIFPTFVLSSQNLTIKDREGIIKADTDWAKGKAKFYVSVGTHYRNPIEDELYFEHLGMVIVYHECLWDGTEAGYNKQIKEKLKAKYGRDMFVNLKHDTKVFYDSLNRLKNRNAIFSGGEKHLWGAFNEEYHYFQYDENNAFFEGKPRTLVTFTISKRGKCKNFKVNPTEDAEFDTQVLHIFKMYLTHFRWLPAKKNGKRVEEDKTFDVVFNID